MVDIGTIVAGDSDFWLPFLHVKSSDSERKCYSPIIPPDFLTLVIPHIFHLTYRWVVARTISGSTVLYYMTEAMRGCVYPFGTRYITARRTVLYASVTLTYSGDPHQFRCNWYRVSKDTQWKLYKIFLITVHYLTHQLCIVRGYKNIAKLHIKIFSIYQREVSIEFVV
jgi:hypothetical protein